MLLDTHVLLWFLDNNPRLPKLIKEKIENTDQYLSVLLQFGKYLLRLILEN